MGEGSQSIGRGSGTPRPRGQGGGVLAPGGTQGTGEGGEGCQAGLSGRAVLKFLSLSTDPPSPRTFPAIVRLTAAVAPPAGAVPAAAGAAAVLSPGWALLLGFVLVLLNGFFVAAEFALIRVRPTQLEPFVERGLRRARIARHMPLHLDAYLSTTQLGITLASLGLGWIGEPAFSWLIEPVVVFFAGRNPPLVHSVGLTISF